MKSRLRNDKYQTSLRKSIGDILLLTSAWVGFVQNYGWEVSTKLFNNLMGILILSVFSNENIKDALPTPSDILS